VTEKLQQMLYTDQRVYLFTSSSTGVMEGSIRQATNKKILNTICGAFSERWHTICELNGVPTDTVEVEWGQAITPDIVDEALSSGEYDAITVVFNETSTGLLNPIDEIAEMVNEKYPDVLILGVQKCFALPPGLTVCAVSDRARERALEVDSPGYYFTYEQMDKKYEKHQTRATPCISLIEALNVQLDDMMVLGLENRWKRHEEMANYVQDWAREHFGLFSDERYLSPTVTNVKNTRGISVADLNAELALRGAQISNGYGPLKEECFRIAHMGDLTLTDLKWLTDQIEDILDL
jgi:aspartate aminotransferase-like enzyme